MVLSIIILLMIAAVAFYHYLQGMFSATISAILAVFAAAVAMSTYEPLTAWLIGGKFPDTSQGMALISLYAGVYLILRIIFDMFIPGNIRLPVLMDKIGAGVMGIVAGVVAAGIFAVALQTMPFGVTVGGFARYEVEESRTGGIMQARNVRLTDVEIRNQLKVDAKGNVPEENRQSLWIPADSLVVGLVDHLSTKGSLAGGQPIKTVHPDLLKELFFSRLGILVGQKATAVNVDSLQQIELKGLYELTGSIRAVTGEDPDLRKTLSADLPLVPEPQEGAPADSSGNPSEPAQQRARKVVPREVDMEALDKSNSVLLVVRVMPDATASAPPKQGGLFSFSTGGTWLLAQDRSDESVDYKDIHPIGTLEGGELIMTNVPDDYMFAPPDKAIDFVFRIPKRLIMESPSGNAKEGEPAPTKWRVKDGVVLVVKRMARIDLSGQEVEVGLEFSPEVQVMRKPTLMKELDLPLPSYK